jgi:hypothetical protein
MSCKGCTHCLPKYSSPVSSTDDKNAQFDSNLSTNCRSNSRPNDSPNTNPINSRSNDCTDNKRDNVTIKFYSSQCFICTNIKTVSIPSANNN